MDGDADGDAIEEIGLSRKSVFGKKSESCGMDLMKAVIISIRKEKNVKTSQNVLTAMLETLFAQTTAEEKKRVLSKNYGMTMTAEFERRIRIMCNLSEAIKEDAMKSGYEKGMERGIEKERLTAIHRMIRAGASRKQILSYGYTPDEYVQAENMQM